MSVIETTDYQAACDRVGSFVLYQALAAANELQFGWEARPDAPDTYDKLTSAYQVSERSGLPLPVSSLFCSDVIYKEPTLNHAMRFWHDTLHVRTGLSFALDDELELGLHHLKLAEVQGIKKHSLEWQILRIDLLGQNYLLGVAKRFPVNQRKFVEGCILHGLDDGILLEVRQN